MIAPHSLASIRRSVDEDLGEKEERLPIEEPSDDIGFLIAGSPFPQRSKTRLVAVTTEQWSKLIGILFCQPATKLAKEEIVGQLDYFHYRSGFFVDFFCAGYGANWPRSQMAEHQQVANVHGVDWLFSANEFNSLRKEVEAVTQWTYSGECELLLLVARKSQNEPVSLDFSCAIACNLEQMQKDQAFTSVRALFEHIFRFGETYDGSDPVWELSDKLGLGVGKDVLKEAIISILPESAQKLYRSAKHFAIRDISK